MRFCPREAHRLVWEADTKHVISLPCGKCSWAGAQGVGRPGRTLSSWEEGALWLRIFQEVLNCVCLRTGVLDVELVCVSNANGPSGSPERPNPCLVIPILGLFGLCHSHFCWNSISLSCVINITTTTTIYDKPQLNRCTFCQTLWGSNWYYLHFCRWKAWHTERAHDLPRVTGL